MRQLALWSGLVMGTLLGAACVGDSPKVKGDTVPTVVAAKTPQVSKPCDMDHPSANDGCKTVMEDWDKLKTARDTLNALKRSSYNLSNSPFARRAKRDPNCRRGEPHHVIRAAKDLREMPDPLRWKDGVVVTLAQFEPRNNGAECADAAYGVGGQPSTNYYLVVRVDYSMRGADPHADGDTIIGEWTMLAVENSGASARRIRRGKFIVCGVPHPAHEMSTGEFQKCGQKKLIFHLADSLTFGTDAIFAAISTMRGDSAGPGTGRALSPTLPPDVFKQLKDAGVADIDNPAWVSCALGCCTAAEPEDPIPLHGKSAGLRLPRRGPTVAVGVASKHSMAFGN